MDIKDELLAAGNSGARQRTVERRMKKTSFEMKTTHQEQLARNG